jgi:hypothetical protein
MNIFIGWSGDISKLIAIELRNLTHKVLQKINKPFVSDIDIIKGAKWLNEITKKLQNTNFGIFCITPENINSNWIHYEAGVIDNLPKKTYVCPLLFELEIDEIKRGPLFQFQFTKFNKDDLLTLFKDINKQCSPSKKIDNDTLTDNFNNHWSDFEELYNKSKKLLEKKIIDNKEIFSTSSSYKILLSNISNKVNEINSFLHNNELKISESQIKELKNYLSYQPSKSHLDHLLSCWQDFSNCINTPNPNIQDIRTQAEKFLTPLSNIFLSNDIKEFNTIKEKNLDVSSMNVDKGRDEDV